MDIMITILLVCSTIFITILFFKNQTTGKKGKPLPSPPRIPLIGNIHQLGSHPHRSLCSLSRRYGALIMLFHFGRVPVLVVSSADAARDVLKTHDRIFASRPRSKITEMLLYNNRDVATAPYGEYWRQMKSACVLHLLSNKMVRSFRDVRQEEIVLMMEKIRKSSSMPVNLSQLLTSLSNDVICRVALGRKYSGETNYKELVERITKLLGTFSVGSYVPCLGWIDWIRGLDGQLKKTSTDIDEFLERVVQDHADGGRDRNDFVDVLFAIERDKSVGFEIDMLSVKAIILDVFVGGTDTSYALMEWAMTELLRHPECLNRLQEEVRTICKDKSIVSEEDLQDMKYLKAVIKETLRLHPPVPLLVPHASTHDVRLRDYHIPAGTQVMINVWSIGRDAATWGLDAEKFRPERHLVETSMDFRGQDFELIPFGAGRRICPGISFAVVLNEEALANLVNQFDWRLPVESTENQTDIAESTGISVHRMFPLYAIASSTLLDLVIRI